MALTQRLRQGIRALLAFSQPIDYELLRMVLTPQQMALFCQLSRSEQLHSLNVLRTILAQQDYTPHDLALAALMHDVGKSLYRMSLWQKVMVVIARKSLPRLYYHWRTADTLADWRAPFVVSWRHPEWGARLLADTGASERAVWLVAHHQEPNTIWQEHPYSELLRRLQMADDMN